MSENRALRDLVLKARDEMICELEALFPVSENLKEKIYDDFQRIIVDLTDAVEANAAEVDT